MTVLQSIPSIGRAGAEKLQPFLNQTISPQREQDMMQSMRLVNQGGLEGDASMAESAGRIGEVRFLEALRAAKFDDPSMEAYRKAAIQHWSEYSQLGDTIIGNLTRNSRQ